MHRLTRSAACTIGGVLLVTAGCSSGDDAAPTTTSPPSTTVPDDATTTDPRPASTTTVPVTATPAATDPPTGPAADLRTGRPYDVETVTVTFVDESRPTVSAAETVTARTLETTLLLPVADGPVPLIVFSHGYGGHPSKFDRLLSTWAEAGYAVAAPAFPLTNDTVDESIRSVADGANQPDDVVFVLDQLLAGEYADRFDTERLAAAGLSLGGFTTYLAAIDENAGDPRFSAAIVMAAVPPGASFVPRDIPVLVMHGELDPVMPLDLATSPEALLTGPSYLVTLLGAFHAEAFEDADANEVFPDRERYHPVVDETTLAFWDTYLLADPSVEGDIRAGADQDGISTIVASAAG